MGCWNKTCGLTNLHIKAGERAYVFVLEKDEDDSHCYTTHMYKPLLLPFETTYNDYGGGENSSGIAFELIMQGIKNSLHEMPLGENKYHDIAVTKEEFGEELFFDAVHEGRLFRKGHYSDPVKLEYVMFRKDVVDHILEHRVIEKYVGDGKGTGGWGNNYIYYKFSDIVADILPLLQEICDRIAQEKASGIDKTMFKLLGGIEYLFDYNHPNLAAKWLRGEGYRYSRIVDMKSAIGELFAQDTPTEEQILNLEALLTEYIKGVFIDGFMHETRKSWYPAGHEGSQNQEHKPYRLLISAMNEVLDREKAEWESENEGVFEE